MNMEYLDSFTYSARFRKQYPKVNGLFWGYHWLQTVNYDMMFRAPVDTHRPQYELIGSQYRTTELYRTDRDSSVIKEVEVWRAATDDGDLVLTGGGVGPRWLAT